MIIRSTCGRVDWTGRSQDLVIYRSTCSGVYWTGLSQDLVIIRSTCSRVYWTGHSQDLVIIRSTCSRVYWTGRSQDLVIYSYRSGIFKKESIVLLLLSFPEIWIWRELSLLSTTAHSDLILIFLFPAFSTYCWWC